VGWADALAETRENRALSASLVSIRLILRYTHPGARSRHWQSLTVWSLSWPQQSCINGAERGLSQDRVKWSGGRANLFGSMVIREVILWVHVLCGVVWVGACATFVVAAAALNGEPDESSAFTIKVAPQINRLCVPMAIAIPITGIGNLMFAAQARGLVLPAEFIGIVAAKVVLLSIMALGLLGASRAAVILQKQLPMGPSAPRHKVNRRIMALYGLITVAGVFALVLGLWLSGT